jgi:sugar diacid utilization regulator/GAF domain-containing protein
MSGHGRLAVMVARNGDGPESLAELRRWLQAVDALTEAVNSTRSLPAILDLVADSARTLLGFDFCAVLLPDEPRMNLVITGWSGLSAEYVARVNADRPVRLVDGTDPFRAAEQAPSSKAFMTGRPVTITDIATEPEFTPWGGVAREQGYASMVSVPLVAGGNVVGTLNGYHAAVHVFSSHELERLTLLANHAAIALSSARMVGEMQSLTESLRRQRDLLTKSEQIHQQLLAVTLGGGGIVGVTTVLAELVGRAVLIDDVRGTVLAQVGEPSQLPEAGVRLTVEIEADRIAPQSVSASGGSYVVWPVHLSGEVVARVWLPGYQSELTPIDERAVEHGSIVISLEILRRRTAIEVEHRLRGELLADILGGAAPDSGSVRERAERLGHDLSVVHVAIVGRLDPADSRRRGTAYQRALTAVTELAAQHEPRPLVAMHGDQIVGLWPIDPTLPASGPAQRAGLTLAAEAARRSIASIPGVATATVAVSGTSHRTYPQAYRTARGALEIAIRSGLQNRTVTLPDLGVSGLLLQLDDPEQLLDFADRTLSQVRKHDQRRGTQLVATLRAYLDHRQHRSETAAALHLHPNTVTQRLQRIETLTSLNLADPAAVVELTAALTLLDVAQGDRA